MRPLILTGKTEINIEHYITDLRGATDALSDEERIKADKALDFSLGAIEFLKQEGHNLKFIGLDDLASPDGGQYLGRYNFRNHTIELPAEIGSDWHHSFEKDRLTEVPYTLAHELMHAVDRHLKEKLLQQMEQMPKEGLVRNPSQFSDLSISRDLSMFYSAIAMEGVTRDEREAFKKKTAAIIGIEGIAEYEDRPAIELIPRITEDALAGKKEISSNIDGLAFEASGTSPDPMLVTQTQMIYRLLSGFKSSLENTAAKYGQAEHPQIAAFTATVSGILNERISQIVEQANAGDKEIVGEVLCADDPKVKEELAHKALASVQTSAPVVPAPTRDAKPKAEKIIPDKKSFADKVLQERSTDGIVDSVGR